MLRNGIEENGNWKKPLRFQERKLVRTNQIQKVICLLGLKFSCQWELCWLKGGSEVTQSRTTEPFESDFKV